MANTHLKKITAFIILTVITLELQVLAKTFRWNIYNHSDINKAVFKKKEKKKALPNQRPAGSRGCHHFQWGVITNLGGSAEGSGLHHVLHQGSIATDNVERLNDNLLGLIYKQRNKTWMCGDGTENNTISKAFSFFPFLFFFFFFYKLLTIILLFSMK